MNILLARPLLVQCLWVCGLVHAVALSKPQPAAAFTTDLSEMIHLGINSIWVASFCNIPMIRLALHFQHTFSFLSSASNGWSRDCVHLVIIDTQSHPILCCCFHLAAHRGLHNWGYLFEAHQPNLLEDPFTLLALSLSDHHCNFVFLMSHRLIEVVRLGWIRKIPWAEMGSWSASYLTP